MKRTMLAAFFLLLPLSAFAQSGDAAFAKFIPSGYRIVEEVKGDLNKDGLEDYVLIIEGKKNIAIDNDCLEGKGCYLRGIIILFKKGGGGGYEPALENRGCFEPEADVGGCRWNCGYTPPDRYVSVKKGNLYIAYSYLKSGSTSFTFRYQNSDFELIGFDEFETQGPYTKREISINFLTKKMVTKKNKNKPCEGAQCDEPEPVFEEIWKDFTLKEPIKLRNVTYFNDFSGVIYNQFIKP